MKSTQTELRSRGKASKEEIAACAGLPAEELAKELHNPDPCRRTAAAYCLHPETEGVAELLLEQLCRETCLYTRIAVCESLEKGGRAAAEKMIPYLGRVGKNQHRSLPDKVSAKKSYPLPRDLIARTLAGMDIAVFPLLLDVLDTGDRWKISEALDAVGFMAFYHPSLVSEKNADRVIRLLKKESDEIIHKLSLKIYEAEYRILIVWLPEKLHPTCANKLLKIIEEPPMKTVILMVSETPDLILGTIQSRAQRIHIRPIETDAIMNAMVSRFGLSPDDAKHVAHLSSGSFIKAMEAISLGEENKFFLEQFKAMMRNSWARNVKGMKAMADVMAGIGRERQKNFLSYCQHLIRENFMYRFQSPELNYMNLDEASFSVKFSPFVNERNVIDLMEELAKAERHITQNVNAKMVFFDLSLRITVLIKR